MRSMLLHSRTRLVLRSSCYSSAAPRQGSEAPRRRRRACPGGTAFVRFRPAVALQRVSSQQAAAFARSAPKRNPPRSPPRVWSFLPSPPPCGLRRARVTLPQAENVVTTGQQIMSPVISPQAQLSEARTIFSRLLVACRAGERAETSTFAHALLRRYSSRRLLRSEEALHHRPVLHD